MFTKISELMVTSLRPFLSYCLLKLLWLVFVRSDYVSPGDCRTAVLNSASNNACVLKAMQHSPQRSGMVPSKNTGRQLHSMDPRQPLPKYSNLAAALCKLSKYDDAHAAAQKATEVDPDWAKGHWRLGVVNDLQKDFLHSFTSYSKAVELDPNEGAFVKAKEKI